MVKRLKIMSKELDLIDRNELYNQIRLYLDRHSLGETALGQLLLPVKLRVLLLICQQ